MEESNKFPDREPAISLVYKFTDLYKSNHLYDYSNIQSTIKNITKNKDIFKSLLKAFSADSPTVYDEQLKKKNMALYLQCRFDCSTFFEYLKCTKYKTFETSDYGMFFINFLGGKWFEINHKEDN